MAFKIKEAPPLSSNMAIAVTCYDCDELVFDQMYSCSDCDLNNLICESCIYSHHVKDHTVMDPTEQKVIVFCFHKLPCLDYCLNCDVAICRSCYRKHVVEKHDISDIHVAVRGLKGELIEFEHCLSTVQMPENLDDESLTFKQNAEKLILRARSKVEQYQAFITEVESASSEIETSESRLLALSNQIGQMRSELKVLITLPDFDVLENYTKMKMKTLLLKRSFKDKVANRKQTLFRLPAFKNQINRICRPDSPVLEVNVEERSNIGDAVISVHETEFEVWGKLIVGCYYSVFYEVTKEEDRICIYRCNFNEYEIGRKKIFSKKLGESCEDKPTKAYLSLQNIASKSI